MVYHDGWDTAPPIQHYDIPYNPWDDPSSPPVAPADADQRRAIQTVMDRHPNWSPSQIKAHLRHAEGLDVSYGAVCGVKAGM